MMADDNDRHGISGKYPGNDNEERTIQVVQEHLSISSQPVVTGEVRVEKRVQTESVDVPLTSIDTTYHEERHPVNRVVDQMPTVRYEGDNLIIPVVREEEVVVKRLVLVEEIHLIRQQTIEQRTQSVELRSEKINISHEKGRKGAV